MKALQIIKSVLAVVGLFALGVLTGAVFFRKSETAQTDDAEKAREDKKNEIESTPAADLVSDARNADELRAAKVGITDELRERIRHRLESELQRLRGGAADSGGDGGSGGSG